MALDGGMWLTIQKGSAPLASRLCREKKPQSWPVSSQKWEALADR